jgi:hypothetical protein
MLAIVRRTDLADSGETLAEALLFEEAKNKKLIRAKRLLIASRIQEAKSLVKRGAVPSSGRGRGRF